LLTALIVWALVVGIPRSCGPSQASTTRSWDTWTHPQQVARKHLNLANQLAKCGASQDAAEQFRLAITVSPKGSKAWCKSCLGMAMLLHAQSLTLEGSARDEIQGQANQYYLASIRESENVRVMLTEYFAGQRMVGKSGRQGQKTRGKQ